MTSQPGACPTSAERNMAELRAMLPAGIRSRRVDNGNGLDMHVLEAGYDSGDRPCVLLLHGFPELAYSWRRVMLPLARAGYYVVAPDQRGYGYTTGWDGDYHGDLAPFRMLNLVRDAIGLLAALGRRTAAVVGHDFGAPVAAWCALIRPDLFKAAVMMSAPFAGPPSFPFASADAPPPRQAFADLNRLDEELAALDPPRKHYRSYFCGPDANHDMLHSPQGLHAFLRAYYHHKSGDWPGNEPHPLASRQAAELARMPTYYIMERDKGMAATVAAAAPSPTQAAACRWLSDDELAVYTAAYAHTGFQGGLQWYRAAAHPEFQRELLLYSGRSLDVPSCFIAGSRDWGIYQTPGAFEAMRERACTRLLTCRLIPGVGHWVQQEAHEQVAETLLDFLPTAGCEHAG